MEKFKAVEKAMKTKAYSKEGLSAAAKLDPKEQAKVEASDFLSTQVDDLEKQIEMLEAEGESIQATMKKGKNNTAKAERIAEIERIIERHKWHQGKMELIRRSLENGGVEAEQVNELEESIRYYVSDGMNEDFMEDEEMYDELDLEEDEGTFGMGLDNDKNSSLDTQSVQTTEDATPESEVPKPISRKSTRDDSAGRRPSAQVIKSPLPALATLHTPLATISNGSSVGPIMKPASVPPRPEGLKYASAAAAAAASDKNNVGIAPLPPPPGAITASPSVIPAALRSSAASSPAISAAQLAQTNEPRQSPAIAAASAVPASSPEPSTVNVKPTKKSKAAGKQPAPAESSQPKAKGLCKTYYLKVPIKLTDLQHLKRTVQQMVLNGLKRSKRRSLSTTSLHHYRIWLSLMKPRGDTNMCPPHLQRYI